MWLLSRIPAVQQTILVRPMPSSGLGDGRDIVVQDPYAADTVVSGVPFCVPGQVGHFQRPTGGNSWDNPQNRLIHAQTYAHCHGAAG